MREFRGISASPGIAIQHAFAHFDDPTSIPKYHVEEGDIPGEIQRFEIAVDKAAEEIRGIQDSLPDDSQDQKQLLEAQLLMLRDPEMADRIARSLPGSLRNAEWVLADYIENMVSRLEISGDEYLAERSLDLLDVSRRITSHLLYQERHTLVGLDREVILIAPNLLPSETILLDPGKVRGLAMDAGGKTSHTAILARSFGIPAVLGLRNLCRSVRPGDLVIIDCTEGLVILEPDEATLVRYRDKLKSSVRRESQLIELKDLPAQTVDGQTITLMANIEIPGEIETVRDSNAQGIGLFRSEFLFLDPRALPDEDRQYEAYTQVLDAMDGKPVTIRTLDVGGDKVIPGMEDVGEHNPLLGWRAIRFCLVEQDLFRTQIRALLRASAHGNLRIMFPLISNLSELDRAKTILAEERADLEASEVPMAPSVPVGIMIEVPSAAMIADILAKKADFFSIGTNDLIQYTIAVDRGNEKIADLYTPFHPAILRFIKQTIEAANAAGIPVGMCGEMAADPAAAVLFLAMGLHELSMGAFSIPSIKRIIRSISSTDAQVLLDQVMSMECHREIDAYLNSWLGERFDDIER